MTDLAKQGLLELENEEFWSAPLRTRSETQKRLSKEGFRGLALDGPKRVPLDGRTTIPVVAWHVASFRDAKEVSFDASALVVATTVEGGLCAVRRLFDPRVSDTSRRKPGKDTGDPGEGTSYRAHRFDVLERLPEIPRKEDTCLVTLLLQGQVSNRVRCKFSPPLVGFRDPAVEEFLAQHRRDRPIVPAGPGRVSPLPGDPLPSFRQQDASPPLPEGDGVALAVPAEVRAAGPCVVHGAFRLPVRAGQRIGPEAGPVGDPAAKAVVPVSLLLTGDRLPGPYQVRLQVPVHDAPRGESACGFFALDVAAQVRLPAQRYFVYAFSGAAMSGPEALIMKED